MTQKYFNEADALYNAGEYDKAIEKYNAAFAIDPTCKSKSIVGKAWCVLAKNDFESAIELCDKALELKHSSTDVYYIRGRCRFGIGSFALAASDFSLFKENYYQAKCLFWKAICLVKSGRHLEALDDMLKAVTDFSVPEDYDRHFTDLLPSAVMEILGFLKSKSTTESSDSKYLSLDTKSAAAATMSSTTPTRMDHVKNATAKALYVLAWIHYNSEEFSIAGQLCKKAFKLIMLSPQVNTFFAKVVQSKLNYCRNSIAGVESKLIMAEEERQKNIQTTTKAFDCKFFFNFTRV